MTHTSWRDDFTRIVKHRAIAYSRESDGYHQEMPFEDVHGNGGLLTTVGDLLQWNENFVSPRVGDARFVADEQTPGRFNDGREHEYALGLFVGKYRGVREVGHSGATAGYRAFLSRYPDQHMSVAVLCNAGDANPTRYAHEIVQMLLGDRLTSEKPPASEEKPRSPEHHVSEQELRAYAGQYVSDEAEVTYTVELHDGELVLKRRPDTILKMKSVDPDRFEVPSLGTVTFQRDASGSVSQLGVAQDRVWDLRFTRMR
jgi:CubicO group peptidase (beta-lactamase class C family)